MSKSDVNKNELSISEGGKSITHPKFSLTRAQNHHLWNLKKIFFASDDPDHWDTRDLFIFGVTLTVPVTAIDALRHFETG